MLHLIREQQVSLYDIPIARIAEQYMEAIQNVERLGVDKAAEYLELASRLLAIKSRFVLSQMRKNPGSPTVDDLPAEDEDPRAGLIKQLEEYQDVQRQAGGLRRLEEQARKVFPRGMHPELPSGRAPLTPGDVQQLAAAMKKALKQALSWREMPKVDLALEDKMEDILRLIPEHPDGFSFGACLTRGLGRLEVIVTFLALLEMLRHGVITIVQPEPFSDVMICGLDLASAAGNR